MRDLNECRAEIDRIDAEIQELLERRLKAASEIAAWKRANGRPVYDPAREAEKLDALREKASTPELGEAVAGIYRDVMAATRRYEVTQTETDNAAVRKARGEARPASGGEA